jgi:hypothetical protein
VQCYHGLQTFKSVQYRCLVNYMNLNIDNTTAMSFTHNDDGINLTYIVSVCKTFPVCYFGL